LYEITFSNPFTSALVGNRCLKRTAEIVINRSQVGRPEGEQMEDEARVLIRAGDVEIDLSGAQSSVDERLTRVRDDDTWSIALSRIRNARERAIEAAVDAAREAGLPERGSAFRALIENCSLIRKPDQVLGAIQYLRDVEGVNDSPPRVIDQIFEDAGLEPPGNLSLYLNRLRERGFLVTPPSAKEKNRYAILTPEGRAHLDKRSRY
jgi:hypothetical protein